MTLSDKIAWDDNVLPFQLDAADMRGRIARLDGVLETILGQHAYPPPVEALVAEAALLTAMIGQAVKLRWKLSLQIRGDGPVHLIATDWVAPETEGAPARLRAYAGFDREALGGAQAADAAPFALLGQGIFAVTIDQGAGTTPYQGLAPLAGASLADSAADWFARSEQLPTRFAIAMGRAQEPGDRPRWRAGGLMLQHMPKAPDRAAGGAPLAPAATGADWRRVNARIDRIEEIELIGPHVAPTDLLLRLFRQEAPRIFDGQPVRFGCSCSQERVQRALAGFSAREIESMISDQGTVTADCQFCGAHYVLDPGGLGRDGSERDGPGQGGPPAQE